MSPSRRAPLGESNLRIIKTLIKESTVDVAKAAIAPLFKIGQLVGQQPIDRFVQLTLKNSGIEAHFGQNQLHISEGRSRRRRLLHGWAFRFKDEQRRIITHA